MADELLPIEATEARLKKLQAAMERRYLGFGGIICTQSPDGRTVSITQRLRRGGGNSETEEIMNAKITDVSAVNGAIRKLYQIELGYWNMDNPVNGGTWVKTSGTRTLYAFNSAEDMNTFESGTGTIGTGNTEVAQSDGTIGSTSCAMLPLPIGGYCQVKFRGRSTDGQLYYTIINFANSAEAP